MVARISVRVPLKQRSLVVVSGPARYVWFHSIDREDIHGRRIAMTFRELSSIFIAAASEEGGEVLTKDQSIGKEILHIARQFKGAVCGGV